MATKRSAPSDFEAPPAPTPEPGGGAHGDGEFESPASEAGMAADAAQSDTDMYLGNVDGQLLSAKAEIEKLLASLAGDSAGVQSRAALDANIVGVGIGLGEGSSVGGMPGDPVLEIYTIEPEAASETRARVASAAGVSAMASDDFPINVVRTGIVDAYPHRMRLRPAPGGISIGNARENAAGTLGCLSRGRQAPRNARLMLLTNNHVVARVNAAALGEAIVQQGVLDGGSMPGDQIAILERFVPINFAGGNNLVDCATGWCWPERVRRELMYISGGIHFFNAGAVPVAAIPGMPVGKSGRTTQLTSGRVTAIGVTVNVNYGGGRVGRFVNQFSVRATSGDFSRAGDSGSLIWTWDARRAPVGLLFAGGNGTTFANRIGDVLNALDINLVV